MLDEALTAVGGGDPDMVAPEMLDYRMTHDGRGSPSALHRAASPRRSLSPRGYSPRAASPRVRAAVYVE
jgi:hypothetical protein